MILFRVPMQHWNFLVGIFVRCESWLLAIVGVWSRREGRNRVEREKGLLSPAGRCVCVCVCVGGK